MGVCEGEPGHALRKYPERRPRRKARARVRSLLDITSTQAPVVTPRAAEINVVMVAHGILPRACESASIHGRASSADELLHNGQRGI